MAYKLAILGASDITPPLDGKVASLQALRGLAFGVWRKLVSSLRTPGTSDW
jgi:hypothetical protein